MDETENIDLYEGLTTAQRQTIFGRCTIDDEDFQRIFIAKCEDFKIKYSEKLFQRFLKHQTKKPFYKVFEMDSCSLGPKASSVVAEVIFSHLNIRVISMSGNNLGNYGAFSMADLILQADHIISLDLSSNAISDEGGSAIFQALAKNKSLISLRVGSTSGVSRNAFGLQTLRDVQGMLYSNNVLEELDLSMTEINADTVQYLANGLMNNHSLQVLNLSNNNIQTRGAAAILKASINSNLREINFANNHLKDDISNTFAHFLTECKTIQSIDLSGNSLTSRFTNAISVPLTNSVSSLQEINLSNNPIGGKGLIPLGPALATNDKMRTLTFVQCKIESSGFAEFCQEFEKNESVTKVNFGHNPIRDEGAVKFANVIKNHPLLKDVDLELCEIGDEGAEQLFPALSVSPNVERFSAKNNLIRNGVVIQHAVSDNQKLLSLNIEYNDIDFKVFTEIQRLVKENQRMWRDGQKKRIEEACIVMAEVEGELRDTRAAITDERLMIEHLIKELAEGHDNFRQAEIDRDKHYADLEKELEDITNDVQKQQNECRAENDKIQGQCNIMEAEISALANKNEREMANFQRECKVLKNLTKAIADLEKTDIEETKNWANQLEAAKMKYRDMRSLFEGAYEQKKQEIADEELRKQAEEAAAREAENPSPKKGGKKGGKSGRKKSPKKGAGSKLTKGKSATESATTSKKSLQPPTSSAPSATTSKKDLSPTIDVPPAIESKEEGKDEIKEENADGDENASPQAPAPAIKEPSSPKKSKNPPRRGKRAKK